MTDTTTEPERPRKLRRSSDDRMIAGVAGGIGEYFGIDPVLIRIGFVALALLGGAGLVVYPIAWILVPDADGRARGIVELLRITALILGVLIVLLALFLGAAAAVGLGGGTSIAIAVLVAGIALFVAAFGGGRLRWLILPVFAIALGGTAAAATDVDLHGGFRDDEIRLTGPAIARHYEVGAGRLSIDLHRYDFAVGTTTRINARVGAGELQIIVPPYVCVGTDSHVGAGAISWFGHDSGGTDLDLFTQPSERDKPRVVIHADVGLGHLDINDGLGNTPFREVSDSCEEVKTVARPH